MKNKLKNDKRGVVQFIWAGAALVAAGAWLVSKFQPKTPAQTFFSSVPIYVWVVAILILLVILRRRN